MDQPVSTTRTWNPDKFRLRRLVERLVEMGEIEVRNEQVALSEMSPIIENTKKGVSGDPRSSHVRNFLECVKSRKQPDLNLDIGHHVSTVAHLGNIAYRTGRKITWDAEHERVVDDPEADHLVGVKYRRPWKLDYSKRA